MRSCCIYAPTRLRAHVPMEPCYEMRPGVRCRYFRLYCCRQLLYCSRAKELNATLGYFSITATLLKANSIFRLARTSRLGFHSSFRITYFFFLFSFLLFLVPISLLITSRTAQRGASAMKSSRHSNSRWQYQLNNGLWSVKIDVPFGNAYRGRKKKKNETAFPFCTILDLFLPRALFNRIVPERRGSLSCSIAPSSDLSKDSLASSWRTPREISLFG